MRYGRHLLAALGVTVIIGSVVYVARPAGHIPPYDANLVRLAESVRQGYCAGRVFMLTSGTGNADQARKCRSSSSRSDTPDLLHAQFAFCQGIVAAGWQGTPYECLSIMTQNEDWPTYDGSITASWNRARPYPLPLFASSTPTSGDASRTGNHEGNTRTPPPTNHR